MKIGVPRETASGERRIALVPESAKKLVSEGNEVVVQSGGPGADFSDEAYAAAGARVVTGADEIWSASDLVLKIQPPSAAEGSSRGLLHLTSNCDGSRSARMSPGSSIR